LHPFGFDPSLLPDATDPTNLEKASGRGVLLMRMLMDEVFYNSTGNEVTLVKHCTGPP
jgi:anti-sigma regulatory factor (Ser/Thr protein kinase)